MTARARRTPATTAGPPRFIVLTGLSGSGKSQAVRALEDLGYFCVDNLPTSLMPTFAELTLRAGGEIERAAIVVDVREKSFLSEFPKVFGRLKALPGLDPILIFMDATDEALVRRFSETRRPHPLAPGRSAIEGIRLERAKLRAIRKMADEIVDTTEMTVHELRRAFMSLSTEAGPGTGPVVTILSFGFKHGLPVDSDLVFDVRFLPNPHFVPGLRQRTGRDAAVKRYLAKVPETQEFIERVAALLRFLIPRYAREGKSYLTVAIGCTGGRHRSVAVAEALRRELRGLGDVRLRVKHRDIGQGTGR